MQNLNLRYPLLYTTPNCVYCQAPEDILHLLTCPKQKHNLQQIIQTLISNTAQQLNISSELSDKIYIILSQQTNTPLYSYFLNLIQGLFSISQYDNIRILLHKTTTPFFIALSNTSLNWFHQHIKAKCSKIYSLTLPSQSNSNTINTPTIDPTISIKNWLILGYTLTNCIY